MHKEVLSIARFKSWKIIRKQWVQKWKEEEKKFLSFGMKRIFKQCNIFVRAWSKSILRLKNKVKLFCCCTSYCALIIKQWSGKSKCYGLKILNQARLRREGNNQINHLRNFLLEVSICLWSSTYDWTVWTLTNCPSQIEWQVVYARLNITQGWINMYRISQKSSRAGILQLSSMW